jgi:hypothetical protein
MARARNGQHIDQATRKPYTSNPAWPGISTGHNAFCLCTWAMKDGLYQVKNRNLACPLKGHGRAGITAVASD